MINLSGVICTTWQAKRDWKEMESKKDEIRKLSNKCVELKALLLQHAPGNQVCEGCRRDTPLDRCPWRNQ